MTLDRAGLLPSTVRSMQAEGKRIGVMRRLYNWVLSWADRPGGAWALFFIAFAESSFFPIPPDVLLIALCVGSITKSYRFALICATGSLLGAILGYAIGYWGYEFIGAPIVKFYHGEAGEAVKDKIALWYDQYGFWGTLAAAITPIPFKVFTIASGTFEYPFGEFMLAAAVGRSLRFFAVATFLFLFGAKVKTFIEKYFNWCACAFFILLLGGFFVLKYIN